MCTPGLPLLLQTTPSPSPPSSLTHTSPTWVAAGWEGARWVAGGGHAICVREGSKQGGDRELLNIVVT